MLLFLNLLSMASSPTVNQPMQNEKLAGPLLEGKEKGTKKYFMRSSNFNAVEWLTDAGASIYNAYAGRPEHQTFATFGQVPFFII